MIDYTVLAENSASSFVAGFSQSTETTRPPNLKTIRCYGLNGLVSEHLTDRASPLPSFESHETVSTERADSSIWLGFEAPPVDASQLCGKQGGQVVGRFSANQMTWVLHQFNVDEAPLAAARYLDTTWLVHSSSVVALHDSGRQEQMPINPLPARDDFGFAVFDPMNQQLLYLPNADELYQLQTGSQSLQLSSFQETFGFDASNEFEHVELNRGSLVASDLDGQAWQLDWRQYQWREVLE